MTPTGVLLVTFIFLWGRCPLELAQRPSCVALVLHLARRSTPFWVTNLTTASSLCLFAGLFVAELRRAQFQQAKRLATNHIGLDTLGCHVASSSSLSFSKRSGKPSVLCKRNIFKHSGRCKVGACRSRLLPFCKLTWLVLGGDPAARSHRVEQFTAL